MVAYDTGCIRAMGWFTGMCHGVARLDRGDRIDMWGRAMGTQVTGWIGAMGLNHGDMWQWLDRGNGIVSWGHATLAGAGQWVWFMAVWGTGWNGVMGLIQGACHRGTWHWLDQGDGIDLWGCAVGHATRAGSGRWDWFMGYVMGAHDWIDWFEGARHWDVTLAGTRHGDATESERWDWFVGACHGGGGGGGGGGGDTDWMWIMRLIYRGIPWEGATGSGRWNWFVEANHGGAWHWLDLGEGIDLCGRVMRVCDTGWIGAMGLIHGRVSNGKVLYGCWM